MCLCVIQSHANQSARMHLWRTQQQHITEEKGKNVKENILLIHD